MAQSISPKDRIFCAIDTTDLDHAIDLASKLSGVIGGAKLGKEFFAAHGPQGVQAVAKVGMPIFLDVKYHDIPNTVAGAIRAVTPMGLKIVNVHAAGGIEMMKRAGEAARETAAKAGVEAPWVIAVTILTSMDQHDLDDVGLKGPIDERVVKLAELTQKSGLDGVVCSAREITSVRAACGPDFKLITPGIRPAWAASNDQKRVVTPADAVAMGSDVLVIGRPITKADDPVDAARRIVAEVS
ncbi:orotidine-5'-phosphate decarboxylase [Thalassospira lucentensis]|uniref:Orotidine 5'-phosphate decarboxylase n=1 Tax=Thalassospira lucentensis TaxID=168935 RepID=A0A358HZL4_9PROT|nr:orotidine-5'-phosphate decarboxylase [Thalassospira lucentensis]HBV00245.1 orotidine-5'-phosphate decarboxylase [Thalassospira lucentensis]HCW65671.1 orotidine-5'-phosphate decarboxylase [Thalassospira lucentensis]|tara:strand:- start:628 stop:1350 length:723 start_codon:yes stop_codon:yes gene_type:complete